MFAEFRVQAMCDRVRQGSGKLLSSLLLSLLLLLFLLLHLLLLRLLVGSGSGFKALQVSVRESMVAHLHCSVRELNFRTTTEFWPASDPGFMLHL